MISGRERVEVEMYQGTFLTPDPAVVSPATLVLLLLDFEHQASALI